MNKRPIDRDIAKVEAILRSHVIITGDSTWDMRDVAIKIINALSSGQRK